MEDNKKCKKFVAILDSDSIGFFLADIDNWNNGNQTPEDEYDQAIYDAIEALGGCYYESENHFDLDDRLTDEQLKEFLSPLPWIKVVDDFRLKIKDDYPAFEYAEDEDELE